MDGELLVLVRHGQSEWNEKNLFTGVADPGLTQRGRAEALKAGVLLQNEALDFYIAFTSMLHRAQLTLELLLQGLTHKVPQIIKNKALNERDYGDLTGLNKDEAAVKFGKDQVHTWRRSYDIPPPNGESLKMTRERVVPYYESNILPKLLAGKRVLVAAHGNSLRSLVMHLEDISPKDILKHEIHTGVPQIYRIDSAGKALSRSILKSA